MTRNKTIAHLHRQVRLALEQSRLSGKLLVLAVSGGPDSLALLYALHHLRDELGLCLHGAHLNHGLRGEASRADAEFAAETFASLGLPFTLEEAKVSSYRQQHHLSLEEAAREVRYAFLTRVAGEQRADAVALGHTADDQAETILMHIIRGSGLAGLRGMETMSRRTLDGSEITLVRPLLGVSRQETLEYCRALTLTPRMDESNLSPELRRNRVRLELLPLLERYNPAIREALVRLSRSAARDMAYVEDRVLEVWPQIVREGEDSVHIDISAFLKLAPALQAHLLRRAVLAVKGGLEELEQNHIDDMMRLMTGPAGRSLDLPGEVRFRVGYGEAAVAPATLDTCPLPSLEGQHGLVVPGETAVGGWRISAALIEDSTEPRTLVRGKSSHTLSYVERLDFASLGGELWVRPRIPGDRFQPLGMTETKKLQDFMVDSKIPRNWRDRVPLVVSPRGIAWVAGWRIAEWTRVSKDTEQVLELQFEPL
jgi:tRNA(Ile)-lysidine synthase